MSKTRVIAFYLPQFHPVPENDKWWGKGFTEWTNVAKAKPMFRGHYQPRVPSELGFYDLRLPEVRKAQAEMAKDAGVEGFCYWHYWLGNGRQLLNKPLEEVVRLGEPDFPFCLGWANHNWLKKEWNNEVSVFNNTMLMEQLYPGKEDIDNHFRTMLPMFKDKRYMRIDNRLIFLIYEPKNIPDIKYFVERWQQLAKEEGLGGFYFIGQVKRNEEFDGEYNKYMDALNYDCIFYFFHWTRFRKLTATLFRSLMRKNYSRILKEYDLDKIKQNVFPNIYPGWDTTPRKGYGGAVFHNTTPELFEKHAHQIIDATPENNEGEKIVFLKSWNEWAEGNYIEPDLRYGRAYIEAMRRVVDDANK